MKKLALILSLMLPAATVMAAENALTDAQIDQAMKKADPDSDGTVNGVEARKFGLSKQAFKVSNPDKDRTLDKKEFAAAIEHQFKAADPDQDGTLEWKEARKAGIKSKKTFEAANPDKDGHLDLAEYLSALSAQAK